MEIRIETFDNEDIVVFLEEHLDDMRATSPPESIHALDLAGLKKPDITFWTMWEDGSLLACGALKELSASHGEIKSMRTSKEKRGQGIASKMLQHIISEAEKRGYRRLSLETGSMEFFQPARALYQKYGFVECGPFANYKEDPNSVFMFKQLSA